MNKPDASTVSFGFREVSAEEKPRLVRGVFDSVAARYDMMNDLMSFGLHRLWKNALITALKPRAGMKLLDLAGGTGDVSFRALERAPEMRITLCDINAAMLEQGRARAFDRNVFRAIDWVCGDAQALPLPDNSFDACTIAFGIRNVTHIDKALAEIKRVLKPGGHFLCLEFSPRPNMALEKIYDAYSFHVLPCMGKLVAGDAEAYRYLAESIRRFPPPETFEKMMKAAGFGATRWRNLSGGVVALHSGWRV